MLSAAAAPDADRASISVADLARAGLLPARWAPHRGQRRAGPVAPRRRLEMLARCGSTWLACGLTSVRRPPAHWCWWSCHWLLRSTRGAAGVGTRPALGDAAWSCC